MALLRTKSSMVNELDDRYRKCEQWLKKIKSVPNDLPSIFRLHKEMWDDGMKHHCMGPCATGYYRTSDISRMDMGDVYLGGVNGLFTHPIPFWEDMRRIEGVTDYYNTVCSQYKSNLISGVQSLKANIYDKGLRRDKLESNLKNYLRVHSEIHGEPYAVSYVHVLNASLDRDKILECDIHIGSNKTIRSSFVSMDGEFYIPFDFSKGVKLSREDLPNGWFHNLRDYLIADGKTNGICLTGKTAAAVKGDRNPEEMSRKDVKDNIRHIERLEDKGMRIGMKR